MKNVIYIATSLDGYIARKDGSLDWLIEVPNPEGSDFGFSEFMESIDAIVMGKNTFEMVLTFGEWPYTKPLFVLSNSLKSIPDHLTGKVQIISGSPPSVVKKLNSRQFNNLYIDGGKTCREFLKYKLIDEIIISRIPVILGDGIPLFAEIAEEQKYDHIKTEVFNNTIVKSYYKKIGN